MLDCIVVGAGPAGATAAYQLGKQGRSVLVLERASLPRYKPCGGGISPGVRKWLDLDFTPVINNTVSQVQFTRKLEDGVEVQLKNIAPMWMVKRSAFDQFLLEEAQKQGAAVKDNTEVKAIALTNDTWTVTTDQETYTASYIIAADGSAGPMASWLGFKGGEELPAAVLNINTEVPKEKLHTACFEFGLLNNGFIWNFPKTDGYSISGGYFRGKGKPQELKKQLENYATQSGFNLANSQYFESTLKLWNKQQPLHTNRAVIAGEAGGIVDPLIGEGVRPAMFSGLKAAAAIDEALAGNAAALSQYTEIIKEEWGRDLTLAKNLAGLFYQFTGIAYKVAVKKPFAGQLMAKILCGELCYSDVTEDAMKKLKKKLIPGL